MKYPLLFFFLFLVMSPKIFSQTTLLEEGFEAASVPFSVLDEDGDGNQWEISTVANRTGLKGAQVRYNTLGNIDWLITSSFISIPASASSVTMSLWARSKDPLYLERFKIGYSTDDVNWVFDPVNENVPGDWTNYTFTKSNLAGQQVKFAIVCVSVDEFYLNVDDILITAQTSSSQNPVVSTSQISSITTTTASGGGNVTQAGSSSVTARGVCWSTSPNPTVSLSTKTVNGSGTGAFTSSITGLSPGTLYYVRAYATNSAGTGYGSEVSFTTTSSGSVPVLSTNIPGSISSFSALGGGNVTQAGSSSVTARGVCWSASPNPTISLSTKTFDGSGTGAFTSSITGLSPQTLYYVRAYATNSAGTGYGSEVSFTTLPITVSCPTVTSNSASSVTANSAISGGNVTSDGGGSVTTRGVCYSISNNPTINSGTVVNSGSGTGSFIANLSGLSAGTTYYLRAFATNSAGTCYGSTITFTTLTSGGPCIANAQYPTTTITGPSSNGQTVVITPATSGCNFAGEYGVLSLTAGSYSITSSISSDFFNITSNTNSVIGSGTSPFSFTISSDGLYRYHLFKNASCSTENVCRGVSIFRNGTVVTNGCIGNSKWPFGLVYAPGTIGPPSVQITPTSSCNNSGEYAEVSLMSSLVYRLFSTIETDYFTVSKTNDSILFSGQAPFEFQVANQGTYRVHIFSSTSCISDQICRNISIARSTQPPMLTTNIISDITAATAKCGGNISLSSAVVTARGVCWSTSPNPTINDNKTNNGNGNGQFISNLTGLASNTTYYVRAYATSFNGTGYGNQVSFTTLSTSAPTVQTSQISSITINSALCGGNVTVGGNLSVTARGVCWSTSQNPTINGNKTSDGTGLGSFSSSLTGLNSNTTYYVRAYATNSIGTSYGSQVTFTTLSSPNILTTSVNSITSSTANSGGNVTFAGSSPVTARGVCWSTSPNPTILASKTIDGGGTGVFTSLITNLSPGTTYYLRAYATNSVGTSYGIQVTFTTLVDCPTDPEVFLENLGFLDQSVANSLGNQYFANYDLPPAMQYNQANPLNLQDLGKPIRFKVKCRNERTNGQSITSGSCVIRTTDPNIIITDSVAGLNNLLHNTSAWSSNEFEIIVSPNVTTSYTARIDFIVKTTTTQYISRCIPIPIRPFSTFTGISNIAQEDYYLIRDQPPGDTDCSGDGDGICETNEQIETRPAINNLSEFEASYVTGFFRNLDNFSGINILTNQTGINGGEINAQCWYNYVNSVPAPIPPASSGNSSKHKSGKIDFVFKYNYQAPYAFDLYLIMTGGFRIFGPGTTPVLMNSSAKIAYNQGQPLAPDYPVQIADQMTENIFSIFPNPSNGTFIVKKPAMLAGEHHTVKVYGLLGQHILSSDFHSSSMQINLGNLGAKGIYIVEISDRNQVILGRKKVLVQ